jgi:predicted transposase YdaD
VRKSAITTPHDALFKVGFENPEHAAAVFRQILPTELVAAIDWETMRREAGSFVDPGLASRHTDLLFSAQLRDSADARGEGNVVLLYLLLEHQSSNDEDMPLRILVYMTRIWESYRKNHRGPLPLIIPVVVSHAPEGWTAPTSFHAMFEPRPDAIPHVAGLVPSFSFLLEDLHGVADDELRSWQLPPVAELVTWLLRDARHFDQLLQSAPDWIRLIERLARGPEQNLVALEQIFRYVLRVTGELRFAVFRAMIVSQVPEAEEVAMTAADELRAEGEAKGRAKGRQEGREEGRAEGRVQARAETLEKLMLLKFGALSPEHAAHIEAATEEQLDVYIERILTATTADALFAAADR